MRSSISKTYLSAIVLSSLAGALSIPNRDEASRLKERDHDPDRGIWVVDCAKAKGACENACFAIKCLQFGEKLVYDTSKTNPDDNRLKSGCNGKIDGDESNQRSVCRTAPFSQLFSDNQGIDKQASTCDEWPPASMYQKDSRGDNAASLRCVPGPENSSAGGQLASFIEGDGTHEKRKGDGALKNGDFFHVEFSNTKPLSFCHASGPDNGLCANDGYQFGLTDNKELLPSTKQSGGKGYAWQYNYDVHNHYALRAGSPRADVDIRHCQIITSTFLDDPERENGEPFELKSQIYVFDWEGNDAGQVQQTPIRKTPDYIEIDGLFAHGHYLDKLGIASTVDIPAEDPDNALQASLEYAYGEDDKKVVKWKTLTKGAGGFYCNDLEDDGITHREECWYGCWMV